VVALDFGAKAFLNAEQIKVAPAPASGSACSTVYGDGVIADIRGSDGFVVVNLKFGAKAFLRPDQVRPARAYPFVPASYWTSGIFARSSTKAFDAVSASVAKNTEAVTKPHDPATAEEEPSPAHPSEEKDASEVPPPAQAEPPATVEAPKVEETTEDTAEETETAAATATGESSSKKKKKKKGKN